MVFLRLLNYIKEKLKLQNQLREVRLCFKVLTLRCICEQNMLKIIKCMTFKLSVNRVSVWGGAVYWMVSGCVLAHFVAGCLFRIRSVWIAIIVIIESWYTKMENVRFSVLFSLKIYSVKFEQRSVLRSSDWEQFPWVSLTYSFFFLFHISVASQVNKTAGGL